MIERLVAEAEEDAAKRGLVAKEQFEATSKAAGAVHADRPPGPKRLSAGLREVIGPSDVTIAREGRLADLVVVGRSENGATERQIALEAALMGTGRPLLLAPPLAEVSLGSRIAIAWNGRAESARAVTAGLPLLGAASALYVLTAETGRTDAGEAERLVTYLAWHGLKAEARHVAPAGDAVGVALLAAAAGLGADLVVMGGYGHSRLREMVLGGVTRHVLDNADLPVLLAH
jgi:nucleotide-binding universal stress UspA family protein